MKRFLILAIVILSLIASVSGLSLTFQNPDDFSEQIACIRYDPPYVATCSWVENTSGGNSYISVGTGTYILSQTALPMTYAAATKLGGAFQAPTVTMFDTSGTGIAQVACPASSSRERLEMKMIGGQAYVYTNGVECGHSAVLAQNPSYVGFGLGTNQAIDDVVWGDTESHYIFGMPADGYFLMKDFLNPAASGFYYANQTVPSGPPTLITSYNFTSSFGKGTDTTENVVMNEYGGGNYQTYATGTAYSGAIQWDLASFFDAGNAAPYGLYVTTIPGTVEYSDTIPYIGSGANILFDKDTYGIGEVETSTVIITDAYYLPSTYSYSVVVQDIYGNVVSDQPIAFPSASPHTASVTYTWADDDDAGIYYGLAYATEIASGNEILMNYDMCELASNVMFTGYVKDATTAAAIASATVNVSQGTALNTLTTDANGSYATTYASFATGGPLTITGSKSGYETYTHTYTPLSAGTNAVNLSLMPNSPTYTGVALGGVVRTPPYNATVDNAIVTIVNGTTTYTVTTNGAGYYIQNSMSGNKWYNVWGSKTGFSNSTTYVKLVVGA